MHSLHRLLVDYDIAMLRVLAKNRGLVLDTNRQPEAVDYLATKLLDPISLRAALANLSPQAQEALDTLLATGGQMRSAQFARKYGQVRPTGPGRLEREAPWQDPDSPAEELWYTGLIFHTFLQDEGGPGDFTVIPIELQPLLPQSHASPAAFSVENVPTPAQPEGGEPSLVHDLFVYLVFLQNNDTRSYADGRLGRRDLETLCLRLVDRSERRLALLRHLAARLGFVTREGQYLRLESAPVRQWLVSPPRAQLAALQAAWRDDESWNDLCLVPSLVCDQETPWRNDPVATRLALLTLMARCPTDSWWSLSSFVAAVKDSQPDFQRPDGDYASWYIRDAATGEYLSGFESWDRVEGALIADLLTGPLHWLGIVATLSVEPADTSHADSAPPDSICKLTAAGERFLGLASGELALPPSPPIRIQPDGIIEIPQPASLYTQFQVERFADPVDLPRGRSPGTGSTPATNDSSSPDAQPWVAEPLRYRLTAAGLGRVLSRGIRVDQIVAFLQQASNGRLPPNAARQLELWAGRYDQVHLEECILLTVKSNRVLRELSNLPETRSLIASVISPTSALVRKRDYVRLKKELRALGFLPESNVASDPSDRG
jgi:hypothetical protein